MAYYQFHDEDGQPFGSYEAWWHNGGNLFGGNDDYDEGYAPAKGWYWWACFPGCVPDGEASGPFNSELEARQDADKFLPEQGE